MESGLAPGKYFELSDMSYDDMSPVLPDGWSVVDYYQNENTGYSGIAFETNDGGIVVAHRGSDDGIDWAGANTSIVAKRVANQYEDAETFVDRIFESKQQSMYIEHTGHSLGGAVAQMVAHKYDSKAVAFDPPGTKEVIEKIPSLSNDVNHDNFETYIVRNSFVSSVNTHIGNVVRVEVDMVNDTWLPDIIDVHDRENIATVFQADGSVNESMIVDGATILEMGMNIAADAVGNKINDALNVVDAAKYTKEVVSDTVETIVDTAEQVGDFVQETAEQVGGVIADGAEFVGDQITNGIDNVSDAVGDLFGNDNSATSGEQGNDSMDGSGIAAELEANMDALYQNLNQFAAAVGSI